MTIAANQAGPVLTPGTAQQTIREMAAVIRTVFGVGLQSSRRTAELAARAEAEAAANAAQLSTQAAPTLSVVQPTVSAHGAPTGPSSIPMPDFSAGIPMPGIEFPSIEVPGIALDESSETGAKA